MVLLSYPVAYAGFATRPAQVCGGDPGPDGSRRRRGVVACGAGIGGLTRQPCWTTRPESFPPARSGPPAPSGRSDTCRTAGRAARGCWASRSRSAEARDLNSGGLKIVSCYQYGKGSTSRLAGRWRRRPAARQARDGSCTPLPVVRPAPRSMPRSTTTRRFDQYKNQVAPYLRSWESVVGHQRTGVYANSKTIDWALHDGLGSYFWQHNWGSPRGTPIRPLICIRSRSTSATSAGSGWTSTKSSSPNSDSGPNFVSVRLGSRAIQQTLVR